MKRRAICCRRGSAWLGARPWGQPQRSPPFASSCPLRVGGEGSGDVAASCCIPIQPACLCWTAWAAASLQRQHPISQLRVQVCWQGTCYRGATVHCAVTASSSCGPSLFRSCARASLHNLEPRVQKGTCSPQLPPSAPAHYCSSARKTCGPGPSPARASTAPSVLRSLTSPGHEPCRAGTLCTVESTPARQTGALCSTALHSAWLQTPRFYTRGYRRHSGRAPNPRLITSGIAANSSTRRGPPRLRPATLTRHRQAPRASAPATTHRRQPASRHRFTLMPRAQPAPPGAPARPAPQLPCPRLPSPRPSPPQRRAR